MRLNQLALSDQMGESVLYISDNLNVDFRAHQRAGEPRISVAIHSVRWTTILNPENAWILSRWISKASNSTLCEEPTEYWLTIPRSGFSSNSGLTGSGAQGHPDLGSFGTKRSAVSLCPEPSASPDDAGNYFDLFDQPSAPVKADAFGRRRFSAVEPDMKRSRLRLRHLAEE